MACLLGVLLMALSFAHGTQVWAAADVATTTYTISGLSFQPKAIRVSCVGIGTGADATSSSLHLNVSGGFGTSSSNRMCVSNYSEDAAGTTVCGSGSHDAAILATIDGAAAFTGLLDLTSITSDGFVLTVDDQVPADISVNWEAWGGDDLTNAEVIAIAEPGVDGDVDYVLSGAFTPSCVMFFGCNSTAAMGSAAATDAGFCVGFATGTASGNNIVAANNDDDGEGTTDTDRYAVSSQCLAMIAVGGGNPNGVANLSALNSDGFQLTWDRSVTDRRYIALAIKGGQWTAADTTIDAGTGSATATVSGLAYAPVGLLGLTHGTVEQTPGTSTTNYRLSFGAGSSTSSRRTQTVGAGSGAGSTAIALIEDYDAVLSGGGTYIDIAAMNSDGFQLIVDTASGAASQWIGYLTFGNSPTGGVVPVLLSQYRRRWGNL